MHLDVCLFVENRVLLGLDWVEPMMQFSFSVSHVHAYFMHTYPFFSIFFVLGYDCVCCLSLSDRLHIAPRRKSTPIRNPFLSGSSSSFDPPIPPLHVRFRDEKAHQDFSENFSKHGIHPERHVILSDFSDTPLLDVNHT